MDNILRSTRFAISYLRLFLRKYYLYIFLGLVLGLILFIFTVNARYFLAAKQTTKKIGIIGNFTKDTLPPEIQEKLSIGLFKLNKQGLPEKMLVNESRVDKEGKIYRLKIKKGITWQDGTEFTAADISYNFQGVSKKIINKYEIEFKLKEPYGPFLLLLTTPLFKDANLIGLGSYKIEDIKTSGKFVNELTIVNPKTDVSNKTLNRINYHFYPSDWALINGLKLGEINEARGLTSTFNLDRWPNVKVIENANSNIAVGVFFNFRSSLLSEKGVRQALFYSLESFKISEPKVYSPISATSWAYAKNIKGYNYSISDAKRLFGNMEDKELKKIKITLIGIKPYDKYLDMVADSWEKLGINVKTYRSSVIPQGYDALITAFEIPTDPDQYYFWHSTQSGNFIGFNSPRIDKALEDGRKINDLTKRKEIYFNFQQYFQEEVPVALLYNPVTYTIIK